MIAPVFWYLFNIASPKRIDKAKATLAAERAEGPAIDLAQSAKMRAADPAVPRDFELPFLMNAKSPPPSKRAAKAYVQSLSG